MVNEKANILFSQNQKLLSRVGCLVVDEMHMLMDLDRGPSLEMALSKALRERHESDMERGRDVLKAKLRIVAISTENPPNDSLQRFLSTTDPSIGVTRVPPLIFHSPERPSAVRHEIVVPATPKSIVQIPVVTFRSTADRVLSEPRLQELDRECAQAERASAAQDVHLNRIDVRQEARKRLVEFVIEKLKERPQGYRLLVFVPGRPDVEDLGRMLKNAIHKELGQHRLAHEELLAWLNPGLEKAEDQRVAENLRVCASAGVLLHYADVDKEIRRRIEESCARMSPKAPSQVVLSTETLSYGVNLAVHDVILLGTLFNTQNRRRRRKTRTPLTLRVPQI